ncbi:hypothetical protein BRC62_04720 [Halobacteriales archaeon QH_10_67_13]|nr:MAG: hypothetical protein BRC62_04720 [Halobacteriales archaeon QH_10_67_13]
MVEAYESLWSLGNGPLAGCSAPWAEVDAESRGSKRESALLPALADSPVQRRQLGVAVKQAFGAAYRVEDPLIDRYRPCWRPGSDKSVRRVRPAAAPQPEHDDFFTVPVITCSNA